MTVSLASQIAEVEYELRMRERVYANLVSTRRLRQAEADMHMAHMRAVLDTLHWLQRNEAMIRNIPVRKASEPDAALKDNGC